MDLQVEFSRLAEKDSGKDLQANFIARSNGQEEWRIEKGNKYSQERFRRLATQAGRLLSPGSDDPIADWLDFVREQPVTDVEVRLAGTEYDDENPENTSVGITFGSIYQVVQASELAAEKLLPLLVQIREKQPEVPLSVSLNPPQATLSNGSTHTLTPEAAALLDALAQAGDWIAAGKVVKQPSRVRDNMPQPARVLIESAPGKGFRIKPTE